MSKAEDILNKLKELLAQNTGARVMRNSDAPEKIPDGGLVIIHDGDPGEPEATLGGFSNAYYSHAIELEIYVQEGDPAQRDARYDELLMQIDLVLQTYPRLEGLVDGFTYGRPELNTQGVEGAAAIKSGTMIIQADYEVESPLN
jgi:hypothetical protein